MSRISTIRRAAVAVTTVAVSLGGFASPAQALPPSSMCVYVLRMHDVYVQRADAAAYVTAPMMIWAATANAGRHEAVWYRYWESTQAAGDWANIATRLGC